MWAYTRLKCTNVIKLIPIQFNSTISIKIAGKTVGESFLENFWGRELWGAVGDPFQSAGYPTVPESWGSLATVST